MHLRAAAVEDPEFQRALAVVGDEVGVIAAGLAFVHSADGKEVMRKNGTVPYLDALRLVMKEVEQEERAQSRGLYR